MCFSKVSLRAFFDYNPLQDPLIPCKEVGVAFSTGDVLHVVNMDDANWWQVCFIIKSVIINKDLHASTARFFFVFLFISVLAMGRNRN